MEAQQQQNQNHPPKHGIQEDSAAAGGVVGNSKNMSNGSNYMCRQTSTRWTPTTDQIRILKDLYYNNGIRSPTADQIQRISARLRQYGKIEGKNVFYWFQNHKARERQKKRFTTDHPPPPHHHHHIPNINNPTPPPPNPIINNFSHAAPLPPPNSHHFYMNTINHKHPTLSPATGVVGSCGNYGSVAMEKSFRDCSISQGETQNCGWVGVDPYNSSTYHSFLEKRKPLMEHHDHDHETLYQEDQEEEEETPELETLPLFPMHDHNTSNNGFFKSDHQQYYSSAAHHNHGNYYTWYRSDATATATVGGGSLELSLNSYTGWSMDQSS